MARILARSLPTGALELRIRRPSLQTHSLAISAKHYVRVRGDHFEKVTGRLVHNAIHDALTTQFTTQHVPAPACNNPQQMLRGPGKGRVVHLGADPCGYMLETSMGDTGLEPVTSRV